MTPSDRLPDPGTHGLAVALVRHGRTADNVPPLRFQGRRDTPLDDTGREQMRRLAESARPGWARLCCSDLKRARESAGILAPALGLEPEPDARWSESSRGRWEGLLMDDVAAAEPDGWASWRAPDGGFRFPDGESLAEHRDRARRALEEVLAEGGLPAVVVCHGGTMRLLTEPRIEDFHRPSIPNASVIALGAGGRPLEGPA